MNPRKTAIVPLLAALLLAGSGCPMGPPEDDFEDLFFDFTYDLKGLCLFWIRDVVVLNPHVIYIIIPHLTNFTWSPVPSETSQSTTT